MVYLEVWYKQPLFSNVMLFGQNKNKIIVKSIGCTKVDELDYIFYKYKVGGYEAGMRHFLTMNITNSVDHIDYMFNTKCVIDVNIWGGGFTCFQFTPNYFENE
jgi:hypothetical protein